MPKVKKITDAKCGLAIVDPELKDEENSGIVHVEFYTRKPSKKDIASLKKELGKEESEFVKIADRLEIYELSKADVNEYVEFIKDQEKK